MSDVTANDDAQQHLPADLTSDRSLEFEYAKRIKTAWGRTGEAIIAVGKLLIEAKTALPHGQFKSMIETEGLFSLRTAEYLMAIAKNEHLSKAKNFSLLPSRVDTLHALAKLPADELEAKLKDGTIRPDMKRKDAAPPKEPKKKTAADYVRCFIDLVDRLWVAVEDLDSCRDDLAPEVRGVALGYLDAYKRKLQSEIERKTPVVYYVAELEGGGSFAFVAENPDAATARAKAEAHEHGKSVTLVREATAAERMECITGETEKSSAGVEMR